MPQITNINEIYELIKAQLEATIPDISPDIRFIAASADGDLERQIFGDRFDGSRKFQILFGPSAGLNAPEIINWNGSLLALQDSLMLRIRYEFGNEDGGYLSSGRLIASDTQLLVRAIHPLVCVALTDYITEIKPNGTINVRDISKDDPSINASILDIQFDYITYLGD